MGLISHINSNQLVSYPSPLDRAGVSLQMFPPCFMSVSIISSSSGTPNIFPDYEKRLHLRESLSSGVVFFQYILYHIFQKKSGGILCA